MDSLYYAWTSPVFLPPGVWVPVLLLSPIDPKTVSVESLWERDCGAARNANVLAGWKYANPAVPHHLPQHLVGNHPLSIKSPMPRTLRAFAPPDCTTN
jgi:hypothetical protein